MKEFYQSPEFDIVEYETEDIITVSIEFGDNDFADPWGKY